MPKIAFEAARKWFEAVILASCRLLMKTLGVPVNIYAHIFYIVFIINILFQNQVGYGTFVHISRLCYSVSFWITSVTQKKAD